MNLRSVSLVVLASSSLAAVLAHGLTGRHASGDLVVKAVHPIAPPQKLTFQSIPSLSAATFLQKFKANAAAGGTGATSGGGSVAGTVRLTAQQPYGSANDYLVGYRLNLEQSSQNLMMLASSDVGNRLVEYHAVSSVQPFLVDFQCEPFPQGSATVLTTAPGGTTQSTTITGPSHVTVVVFPGVGGTFETTLSATQSQVLVTGVDVVAVNE